MIKQNRSKVGLVLLMILACSLTEISIAQSPNPDTVYVTVAVKSAKKEPVPGLKAQNFQILEDNKEQKVTVFAENDGPWEVDLIVAHSKLQPGRTDAISSGIRDAVDTFKSEANPRTNVIVRELNFGSDGLFSTIDDCLLDLQKSLNPRRALVVITDGFERPYTADPNVTDLSNNHGAEPANKLIEYSRRLNIPIYFLYAIVNGDLTSLSNQQLADKDALTTVSEQTGGVFAHADPIHQLASAAKILAMDLRSRYVLGFVSTNTKKDDKWRNLKLKFTAPDGPKVDASLKKKYFVNKPPKQK